MGVSMMETRLKLISNDCAGLLRVRGNKLLVSIANLFHSDRDGPQQTCVMSKFMTGCSGTLHYDSL